MPNFGRTYLNIGLFRQSRFSTRLRRREAAPIVFARLPDITGSIRKLHDPMDAPSALYERADRAQPHPSRRDKCNFYFRLRTRPSRLVLTTPFSAGVHAPFKCRSSSISTSNVLPYDRHLRSAVLYHPRDLFCLSYVHPESQHIR